MRIAIIVNNPARDLAGLSLLATEICQKGAKCYLVPMALQRQELAAIAPDFVLFNQLRSLNEPIVQALIEAKVQIGVLDDEGGVFPNMDWYLRQLTSKEKIRQSVSLFCSWGHNLAEYAKQHEWYRPEVIVATGHPRFDFYAPDWSKMEFPESPLIQDYSKPLILINSRFSRANPAFGSREKEIHTMIKNRGFSSDEAHHFQDTMLQTLYGMVEMTNRLTQLFPQITFIFRPHPFERLETYTELLHARPNLYISRSSNITSWLRIADGIIHRSCTTAIEASMCQVPAFSPAWIPFPDIIESTEKVSLQCSSQETLEKFLQQIVDHRLQLPEDIICARNEVVHDWFYSVDGNAHRRIADAIFQTLKDDRKADIDLRRCHQLYFGDNVQTPRLKQFIKRWKRKIKQEDEQRVANWRQSSLSFDLQAVQDMVQAIIKCQPNRLSNIPSVHRVENVLEQNKALHSIALS